MSDTVEPPPPVGPPAPLIRDQSDEPPTPGALVASLCLWFFYVTVDGIGTASTPQADGVVAGDWGVDTLMLVCAVVMYSSNRRNWARIVLAICGGARMTLVVFVVMIYGVSSGYAVVTVLLLILEAAALVTMFLPAANAWFASSRNAPRLSGPAPDSVVAGTPFCSQCGKQTKAEARFCQHCGESVN